MFWICCGRQVKAMVDGKGENSVIEDSVELQ